MLRLLLQKWLSPVSQCVHKTKEKNKSVDNIITGWKSGQRTSEYKYDTTDGNYVRERIFLHNCHPFFMRDRTDNIRIGFAKNDNNVMEEVVACFRQNVVE